MPAIPHFFEVVSALALLGKGYPFIANRCQRLGTDVFQVWLLMQNTICMRGEEAAKLFYDERLFQRQHAAPRMLQKDPARQRRGAGFRRRCSSAP